jgi:trehalose 6-phosphate phosphatase
MAQPQPQPARGARSTTPPADLAQLIAVAAEATRRLLLCTDFDGSVAPFVRDPASAQPLPAAARAMAWLSRSGAARGQGARCATRLAVVTARDSDDAASRVPLGPEAVVYGNHGNERWRRGTVSVTHAAARWLPVLDGATAELARRLEAGRVPGARLERKRLAIVVHTRGLEVPSAEADALSLAREVAHPRRLRVIAAKHAAELVPPLRRNKASAVREMHRGAWAASTVCVAGDDVADIPMLALGAALGSHGVSVAVVDVETPAAVKAAAQHSVRGPAEWAATLDDLVRRLAVS